MSILIKGMNMPENCHECKFVDILPTCPCNKMADEDFGNNVSLAVEGHKDCPLVPVTPHGRLIDKDALEYDISHGVVFSGKLHNPEIIGANKIINRIHHAPTIIEAEESKCW